MRPIQPPHYLFLLLLTSLSLPAIAVTAQDDVKEAPSLRPAGETYRLRVQNMELGRIEVSADGGLHYVLIGRVKHPATGTMIEKASNTVGVVLRSGGDGLAFTVGAGRVVKLHPAPRAVTGRGSKSVPLPSPTVPSEIATNLPSGEGLFGVLTPPPGTSIRLQVGPQALAPLTDSHKISRDDGFVFSVSLPAKGANGDTIEAEVASRIAALARSYAANSVARARAEGRTVVSGTLTLKAKLPEDEPDPIAAVTYSIDDNLLAAQNVGPFSFAWDTRHAADGEHVVEIEALNRNGRLITHARTLVVVANNNR